MDAERRQFVHTLGRGIVGLAALVAGCATAPQPLADPLKNPNTLHRWGYVPCKEAEEVVHVLETYGTLHKDPNGDKSYSLDISATLPTGEIRIYSINVFYDASGGQKKLQFGVESKPKKDPHLHRVYNDAGIDGTLDMVTDGFASRPPGRSRYASIDVEKRWVTLTEYDDAKGRNVSQKPLDGESMRSLHDAYTHDLLTFLKLYAPPNHPGVPTGKGMLAMR